MNQKIGQNTLNCICIASGTRANNPDKENHIVIRESYKLYYVTKGKGLVTIDGIGFVVSEGQSFLTMPFSSFCLTPDNINPWEYCWVEFKGLEMAKLLSRTTFSTKHPVVDKMNVPELEKLFDITEGNTPSTSYQYRAIGKLFYLLSYYLEYFPYEQPEQKNYTIMALNFIEKNYRNPDISVKSVAEHIKIDRTYLYRLFKNETGTSVIDYINDCRIATAESMLVDKSVSIKDIAYSVGFTDQMYFSKVFKKAKGVSPTEYRNQTQ